MKYIITLILYFFSIFIFSQTTPGEYSVKNIKINTRSSDFGTAFYGKNKIVFAAPKNGIILNKTVWEYNKQPYLDLYIGEISDKGKIINKHKLPGKINSKYNEGIVSFTKDLKTVYFSANNYLKKKYRTDSTGTNNIQLFKATIDKNGDWSNLTLLPFNNINYSSGHPALSIDNTKLYFISDRPESIGKTDIYVVDINKNGTYGIPKNLGPKINTKDREMFPFISDDNVLYFSSDGHNKHGDLDVFASKIFDNTVSDPISLGTPINSKKDDFAYIINDENHKGYFSSNRNGGRGDDDIYSFTVSPPLHIECNQIISGFVKDLNTQKKLPGALVKLYNEEGIEIESVVSDATDASFRFEQPCNSSFKIVGTLEGYLTKEIEIQTLNDLDLPPLEIYMALPLDESYAAHKKDQEINEYLSDNTTITGTISDKNTQKLIPGAEITLLDENNKKIKSVVSDKNDGSFSIEVPKDHSSYKLAVAVQGYLTKEMPLKNLANENELKPVEIALALPGDNTLKISQNDLIDINSIYFDFDKFNIRSDAKFELNKIAKVMQEYPDFSIDVSSHTDRRGTNLYNMKLSNKRAKSTIQYLVNKGIAMNRVSGKGYGEEKLAENCGNGKKCSEFQHQLNRRSEFLIVQNDLNGITIKSKNILNSDNFKSNSSVANSENIVNYNFSPVNTSITYTVQIGAFHGKVDANKFDKLDYLFSHQYDDGFNRYYCGTFKSSVAARNFATNLKKRGFSGAFIVKLKGDKRL